MGFRSKMQKNTTQINLIKPDDWHLHVRNGKALKSVCLCNPLTSLLRVLKSLHQGHWSVRQVLIN
jgi:hypothetical protein